MCGGPHHLADPLPAREKDLVDVVDTVRSPERGDTVRATAVYQRPVRGCRPGDVAFVLKPPQARLDGGRPVLGHARPSRADVVPGQPDRSAIPASASNCST